VFARWARKEGVTDRALRVAVAEMESGLVDARLGGGLFKKRVALPGGGKRGGARTIVAGNFRVDGFSSTDSQRTSAEISTRRKSAT
jgi:hypothetical protein